MTKLEEIQKKYLKRMKALKHNKNYKSIFIPPKSTTAMDYKVCHYGIKTSYKKYREGQGRAY